MKPGRRSRFVPFSLAVLVAAAVCITPSATQIQTLLSSSQNLWAGFPDGIRVSADGAFLPSGAFTKGADLGALPLCSASVGGSVYVGSAPSGDLLKYGDGAVTVAHHFDAPLITALAAMKDGTILVGTSTPAKVYRYEPASGKATLVASLKAQYVWALLPGDGAVMAATGNPGDVFRIDAKGGIRTVLHTEAHHIRSLVEWKGKVWAGSSSPASLYVIGGKAAVCAATLDGEEIAAMGTDGDELLLAVNAKASSAPTDKNGKGAGNDGSSALYIMKAGGTPEHLRSFGAAASSVLSASGGCTVGLIDGRLLTVRGRSIFLSAHWEGSPVTTLARVSGKEAVLTGAPSAIYLGGGRGAHAYVSPVADMQSPSTLGRTVVTGEGAQLFLRSGNTPKPGDFWSSWKPAAEAASLPPAQYAQWKLVLSDGGSAALVSVAYRPENRPPVFASAQVDPPGKVYVRSISQLGDHLVREIHEKDSPFPALAEAPSSSSPPQTYYLAGYRMVTWKVSDPDGDDVRVTVQFRPSQEASWFDLAKNVSDPYYVFDAQGLPDGTYRMRLIASDAASNPEGAAAATTLDLPAFVVDNTPPDVKVTQKAPGRLEVVVTDNTAVQTTRVSVDGKPWQVLEPSGGTAGAGRRTYTFDYPAKGAHWIVFQAVDPYRNETTRGYLAQPGR